MTIEVFVKPRFRLTLRKSAAVSPTVVAMILIIQKNIVTSGTLLSMPPDFAVKEVFMSCFRYAFHAGKHGQRDCRGEHLGNT